MKDLGNQESAGNVGPGPEKGALQATIREDESAIWALCNFAQD